MKLIEFEEQTVVIAKNQPEYLPMPAHVSNDVEGRVTFCWEMTLKERIKLIVTGKLWHQVLTFNQPLQPQLLLVNKPDLNLKELVK